MESDDTGAFRVIAEQDEDNILIELQDKKGLTLLQKAIISNKSKIVEILLERLERNARKYQDLFSDSLFLAVTHLSVETVKIFSRKALVDMR